MASSSSPESPNKKRKQWSQSAQSTRKQPPFSSRRSAPLLQPPVDFLTDSVNLSNIPSPSPERSPTRESIQAKPRRTVNRKARNATGGAIATNNENKRLQSTALPLGGSRGQARKPSLGQISGRSTPQTAAKKAQTPIRTRTPSPLKQKQSSIESPSHSESSPARGYAETYQRIVEEENLAQEDSLDMDGFDPSVDEHSRTLDHGNLQRRQQSSSASSQKASRRRSLQPSADSAQEAQGSNDGDSIAERQESGADQSSKEDLTISSMGSGSSQYTKDLNRLNSALRNPPKAFSKARMGEKVGLPVQNLRRQNGSNESLRSTQSAGSFSNIGSDPGLNVPRAWGRKARPEKDWLSRINSRQSGKFTGDVSKRPSSSEELLRHGQRQEKENGDINEWIAAAAVPLPESERGSSQVASNGSTPTTGTQKSQKPLDRMRDWELDDEFTGRFLQTSESPPIRIQKSALDSIRNREMERLERQAVTTSRLGALRERASDGYLQRRFPNQPSRESLLSENEEHVLQQEDQPDHVIPKLISQPFKPEQEVIGDVIDDDDTGEPVPNTPVVIYRTKSNNLLGVDSSNGDHPKSVAQPHQRPIHDRKDSHDLLRRLSRAASDSPSPNKDEAASPTDVAESNSKEERTPHVSGAAKHLKTPIITGAWVDQTLGQTPRAPETKETKANLRTPFVMGAWIDTPLPNGEHGRLMPTPSSDHDDEKQRLGAPTIAKSTITTTTAASDLVKTLTPHAQPTRPQLRPQEPIKYTGPPLPKSALQNIIDHAKGDTLPAIMNASDSEEDPTLHLGDSTIQSLEDMIANDSTVLPVTPPTEQTSPPSSDRSDDHKLLSPDTTEDLQSYTNILSRLTDLAPSIRDSKKLIANLERAVAKSPGANSSRSPQYGGRSFSEGHQLTQPPPTHTAVAECNEGGEFHDFIWPCEKCGRPGQMLPPSWPRSAHGGGVTHISIPIPKLWHWRRGDWRPRFTWLGVITLVGWGLWIAEMVAREMYCHRLYATSMVGYGVDWRAPRPPFVLVKVIWRKSTEGKLGSLLAPLYVLTRVVLKIAAAVVGYLYGFVFGGGGGGEGEPLVAARGGNGHRGPDLAMGHDEYI